MKPGTSPLSSRLSPFDAQMFQAIEQRDLQGLTEALDLGANPNARKLYRGLKGEKPGLMAVRNGQAQALSLLLERGAACDPELVLGVALFAERSAKASEPTAMADAKKMIAALEAHRADWGVSHRFIGGGLRAIDLLWAVWPDLAHGPAQRLNLKPLGVFGDTPVPGKPTA